MNPAHMGFIVDDRIKTHQGNIFLFDFNHPDKDLVKLTFTGTNFDSSTFSPHGISSYEDDKSGILFNRECEMELNLI